MRAQGPTVVITHAGHYTGDSLGAETLCYHFVPSRSILSGCIRDEEGWNKTETMESGTSDIQLCLKLQGNFPT